MAELVKRTRGMKVGVVTTAEIQDAPPAVVWAHTRQRGRYVDIMDQVLKEERTPDVILGGGRASLLPQSVAGSRRTDEFRFVGDTGCVCSEDVEEMNDVPPAAAGVGRRARVLVRVAGFISPLAGLMVRVGVALAVIERAQRAGDERSYADAPSA